MNYKQDMDAKLFEKFLHETCRLLREKYGDKVALVMDNASYHTVMVRYTYIFYNLTILLLSHIIFQTLAGWCTPIIMEFAAVQKVLYR